MMILKKNKSFNITCYSYLLHIGCREVSVPKPKGYFRIDLPEREYILFNGQTDKHNNLPFSFEYPAYGQSIISIMKTELNPDGSILNFPAYKAKIYLTYKDVNNDFDSLMEQTYKMNVKNHISKADAINEQVIQ